MTWTKTRTWAKPPTRRQLADQHAVELTKAQRTIESQRTMIRAMRISVWTAVGFMAFTLVALPIILAVTRPDTVVRCVCDQPLPEKPTP